MVTKRLGKGLEALIRPYEETQAAATPVGVTDILLSKIKANPNQPRKDGLDKSSLEDLVASIKEKGVITPITVQEVDKGFMLVAGERRWRAAKLAGLKKIPVYIINVTDDAELMEKKGGIGKRLPNQAMYEAETGNIRSRIRNW